MMKRLSAVLISAVLLSACDGSGRPPTAPSVPTPPPTGAPALPTPVVTYTLSGTIFEVTPTGRVPIEGVGVYCDGCGSKVGHTQTYTDADGHYSFGWSPNGAIPLLVGKAGYDVVGQVPNAYGAIVATVNGDTQFDIELARRPSDSYTLANVTLSGVIFEETSEGRMPIGGVAVYCEPCGAESHTWASTDEGGFYSFTGVWTNPSHFPTSIFVRKEGFGDPQGLTKPTPPNFSGPGYREVVVDGDTRFDMQLVRR